MIYEILDMFGFKHIVNWHSNVVYGVLLSLYLSKLTFGVNENMNMCVHDAPCWTGGKQATQGAFPPHAPVFLEYAPDPHQ